MSCAPANLDLAGTRARVETERRFLAEPEGDTEAYRRFVEGIVIDLATDGGWDRPGRALVALGGFGRGELAPRSDIDLLFLTNSAGRGALAVDAVLYPLWDFGFDVGHAVRTPVECAALAKEDLTVATALLDGRLLLGDAGVLEEARSRTGIQPGGSRQMRRWVARILEDVETRRARYGELSHLLEPHIKEGAGGLRDFHATRWLLACLGQEPTKGVRSLAGGPEAIAAHAFLGRVRNVLHVVADRKTDHLTFDFHDAVAARVMPEQSMASFFEALHRASHRIVAVWDLVASRAREKCAPAHRRWFRAEAPKATDDLAPLLEGWCRAGGGPPDALSRVLTEGPPAVVSEALRTVVQKVLRSRVRLAPLLRKLYQLGTLRLVAPEIDAVVHQVHYDARHSYTTGIHCIETLDAFDDLWLGRLEREETHLTRIAGGVLRPWVVRLAALCHDLGKGDLSQPHAKAGAPITREMGLRLGFSVAEADEAARLVEQHHAIPDIAFRRDLEDSATWADARRIAGTFSTMEALTVLGAADIRATHRGGSDNLWGGWKRDLLLTVCSRAFGLPDDESDKERRGRIRAEVATAAAKCGHLDFERLWEQMPGREAIQVPPDLLLHLLVLAAEPEGEPARWRVEARGDGMVEILGVVRAVPSPLSPILGAVSSLQLDVLSFQVYTWSDGTVHLWLRAAHGADPPSVAEVAQRLSQSLTEVKKGQAAGPPRIRNPRRAAIPVPIRIRSLEDSGPFHTVLEVRCRDRKGLLRDLAVCFEQLNLTVTYALVTTVGPMAQDVFHLKDIFGGRVEGEGKTAALLQSVEAVARQESS